MEKWIKAYARRLMLLYVAYIATALIFAGVYEILPEAKGALVNNPAVEYAVDTVCVLVTLLIVPLSVKYFGHLLTRHRSLPVEERAARYQVLWIVRIMCFEFVTIFDLWAYYATINNIGGFCALICVVASLLFVPTASRVGSDLGAEGRNERK